MKKFLTFTLVLLAFFHGELAAQRTPVVFDPLEYEQAKASGKLDGKQNMRMKGEIPNAALPLDRVPLLTPPSGWEKGGGGAAVCDLWQEPDGCPLSQGPNDDGSSALIQLGFDFNLYGTTYNALFINNNGNVSFGAPYGTFSADPFPNNEFVMIAPFWGDVDTGNEGNPLGNVVYCINEDSTRIVITWDSVGYFNEQGDKRNTFQLILTNGFDPLLGLGNNVAFIYQDMQWTTGGASQGVNGFGGIPAVVGANLGDGTSFIQIGTFDQPGTAYDGPVGDADGVDWLDFKSFVFSTLSVAQNIPPLASGTVLCDTVEACANAPFPFSVEFFSPEPGQTTTITVSSPTLSNLTIDQNLPGNTASVLATVTPTNGDVGFHTITITGTDDGTPDPAFTNVIFVLRVLEAPEGVLSITGDTTICEGGVVQLTAQGAQENLVWSNGATGSSISVSQPGVYVVSGESEGLCPFASPPFEVLELPAPEPVIEGEVFICGEGFSELTTQDPYASYLWSTGSTESPIYVGPGTYFVIVTDTNGCNATSAPVTVITAPVPNAGFAVDPLSPVPVGTTATFLDTSSVDGDVITSWWWEFDDETTSNVQFPVNTFDWPGTYTIALAVTTSQGCTDTVFLAYEVLPPDIIIPNVFTPNGDGINDLLEIVNLQYYPNELTVFDRWGKKVLDTRNYNNAWRAADVQDGTYFFVLNLTEEGREFKGHITILR